jgi:hypothetical protein
MNAAKKDPTSERRLKVAPRATMPRREAQNLHRMLSGGLWVDDKERGLQVQDAAIRVAAAQLRAIRFALAAEPQQTEMPDNPDGRMNWCFGDSFGRDDAIIALGGVVAMLDGIHHAAGDITRALEGDDGESEASQ